MSTLNLSEGKVYILDGMKKQIKITKVTNTHFYGNVLNGYSEGQKMMCSHYETNFKEVHESTI